MQQVFEHKQEVYGISIYGMGGYLTDPGEYNFTQRVQSLGINILKSPYRDYDIGTIVNDIHSLPQDVKILIWGSSLGANNSPYVATLVKRTIHGMWGFQASNYGMHFPIPSNVLFAHEVYNPLWLETLGLGAYKWTLAKGNKTTSLQLSERRDLHPGETEEVEQMFLKEMKRVMEN